MQKYLGPEIVYRPSIGHHGRLKSTKCKVLRAHMALPYFFYHSPRSRLYTDLVGGYNVAEMRMYNFILHTDQKSRAILGSRSLLPRLSV